METMPIVAHWQAQKVIIDDALDDWFSGLQLTLPMIIMLCKVASGKLGKHSKCSLSMPYMLRCLCKCAIGLHLLCTMPLCIIILALQT